MVEEVNLKDYNRLKKEYKSLKKRSQMLNDMLYTRNQEYETLKKSANTVDLERFARLSLQYLKEKGIIFFIFKTIKSLFILIVICVLTLIRTIKNDIKNSIINYFKIKKAKKRIAKDKLKQYKFIENKMKNKKYKYVFVFYPYTEWNLPIFQRPQQIALELSKKDDILYLFCSVNYCYDKIENLYEKINENLYVVKDYEFLKRVNIPNRVLHLYSTDILSKYIEVKEAINRGDKVLYEYIDEIHEEITHSLPKYYLKKHENILKNPKCYVVTTADNLFNDVKKYRKKNFILSTNGVNVEDFIKNPNDEIPDRIKNLKDKYQKIICYYGALATWFDYNLIKKIAKKYPNYAIVLIGLKYDNSFDKSKIESIDNVYYFGKINYYELHKYSENVDLLTIPFLINDITKSTSPVKLFEYMATQVPILTTNLNECRKYNSVVIADDQDDFINKIDSTMDLIKNKNYAETELKEAKENTWEEKAMLILNLLSNEK